PATVAKTETRPILRVIQLPLSSRDGPDSVRLSQRSRARVKRRLESDWQQLRFLLALRAGRAVLLLALLERGGALPGGAGRRRSRATAGGWRRRAGRQRRARLAEALHAIVRAIGDPRGAAAVDRHQEGRVELARTTAAAARQAGARRRAVLERRGAAVHA